MIGVTAPMSVPVPEPARPGNDAAGGSAGRARWAALTALAVAALAVGIALFVTGTGSDTPAESAEAGIPQSWLAEGTGGYGPLGDQARRIDGDPMALGAVDAPVVMVVFSDLRCPYCARFALHTEPELVERYVDAGALRIEWRDLPLLGDQSVYAARAGRAAAAQDRFWQFQHEVFAAAPTGGYADLSPESLTTLAERAGADDPAAIAGAPTGDRYDEAIGEDTASARALEIASTPTFVINGHPVVGARPTEHFIELIDQLLARTS